MKTLYNQLRTLYGKQSCVIFTVIKGSSFGEKALFANHSLIWSTKENGFLEKHQEVLSPVDTSGSITIDDIIVFCEVVSQGKKLVICGGGHVSIPIIKMGSMLGFDVTVLEDREQYATDARQAGANHVLQMPYEESLSSINGDKNTFFVIVTRGHRYDKICLEAIIKKEHAYIGMIGSKGKVAIAKKELIEKGCSAAALKSVHAPIGLNITSETPEEIAISILAEIISVKNQQKRSSGYSKKLLRAIDDCISAQDTCVVATIVRKAGSAPRELGTKMVIFPDGSISGTIGGGKMEAIVIKQSTELMLHPKEDIYLEKISLTNELAEEDGMVCGGNVDILYEII